MSPRFDLPVLKNRDGLDGEPDILDAGSRDIVDSADAIDSARENIKKLTQKSHEMCSEAFAELAHKAEGLQSDLSKVAERYREMGLALQEFSEVLRNEQAKAPDAIAAVTQAQQEIRQAEQQHGQAVWKSRSVDPCLQQKAVEEAQAAAVRQQNAAMSRDEALGILYRAIDCVNQANNAANARIRAAIDESGLNDSTWDRIKNAVSVVVDAILGAIAWVWENLEEIALIVNALAIAFWWVPGIGPLLVMSAVAINKVARIKSSVMTTIALVEAIRNEDWRAGLIVIGSYGLNRAIGKGMKGAIGKRTVDFQDEMASTLPLKTGPARAKLAEDFITGLGGTSKGFLERGSGWNVERGLDALLPDGGGQGKKQFRNGPLTIPPGWIPRGTYTCQPCVPPPPPPCEPPPPPMCDADAQPAEQQVEPVPEPRREPTPMPGPVPELQDTGTK